MNKDNECERIDNDFLMRVARQLSDWYPLFAKLYPEEEDEANSNLFGTSDNQIKLANLLRQRLHHDGTFCGLCELFNQISIFRENYPLQGMYKIVLFAQYSQMNNIHALSPGEQLPNGRQTSQGAALNDGM